MALEEDGSERDGVVARAWLDDPSGTFAPETALGREWTPFEGTLSRGYGASTTWVRLRIDPAAAGPPDVAADDRLVLALMPCQLDEVAVFHADRLSAPPVLVGDAHPPPAMGRALLAHTVVFAKATSPFEVLLRLRTQSNRSIDVQALRWHAAREKSVGHHALITAYMIFTVMVMAWAISVWLEQRDAVLGLFIAHQAAALVMAVMLTGVLRLYGPDWLVPALDMLTSLSIPVSTLVTMRFHTRLLGDLAINKTEPRLLQVLTPGPLVGLLLVVLGFVRTGLLINQAMIPCMMLFALVTAVGIRLETSGGHAKSARWRRAYLIAIYVVLASLTMPQSMRALGLIPAPRWSFLGFIAYGLTSAFLMGLLLAYRAGEARRRKRRAERALNEAQREATAQRARAAEQSELLTMLSHELKTPLSVVSLALGNSGRTAPMRERAQRAIGNMRDVINRCEQTARYDDELGRLDTPPPLSPIALDEVLNATIDAHVHGGRIDRHMAADLPACLADRHMALIIVNNLLENALKYGPVDGRVRAAVEPAALEGRPGVALRVANRVGPYGRPDAEHVFDKYHRGARARHLSGSGLGLYLSHRLTSRLGGRLTLRDGVGNEGEVVFELWLPC